jgi:DNA (cytosine-5)-methyltransferase 1
MAVWYNEVDPFAAQWLRNLIAAGLLPEGEVDEHDIRDVRPSDLAGFDQCHFFAGIGGWPLALTLADWPAARPVWTGSCPCQPFSAAGQTKGFGDERHLWPVWFRLIAKCHPPIIFGEQVAAAIERGWLDLIFDDLEKEGYACGAVVLPACAVSAPHIRQRLWFVADSDGRNTSTERLQRGGEQRQLAQDGRALLLAESESQQFDWSRDAGRRRRQFANSSVLGDAESERRVGRSHIQDERRRQRTSGYSNPWRDLEWLACTDGKARPTKPGIQPLAHGVSARVGKLRAAGNAIVSQVAAEFISAYLECP